MFDAGATLPVRVRLPDEQGWVVANLSATVRWRVGGGEWTSAVHSAALVPDEPGAQVEITTPDGETAVETLG